MGLIGASVGSAAEPDLLGFMCPSQLGLQSLLLEVAQLVLTLQTIGDGLCRRVKPIHSESVAHLARFYPARDISWRTSARRPWNRLV